MRVLSNATLPIDLSTGIITAAKAKIEVPIDNLSPTDDADSKQKKKASKKSSESFIDKGLHFLSSLGGHDKKHLAPERKAIILHIHGGGFVAMSSGSHQNNTRVWANEIGIPVFSVDYRLSP